MGVGASGTYIYLCTGHIWQIPIVLGSPSAKIHLGAFSKYTRRDLRPSAMNRGKSGVCRKSCTFLLTYPLTHLPRRGFKQPFGSII